MASLESLARAPLLPSVIPTLPGMVQALALSELWERPVSQPLALNFTLVGIVPLFQLNAIIDY